MNNYYTCTRLIARSDFNAYDYCKYAEKCRLLLNGVIDIRMTRTLIAQGLIDEKHFKAI